MEELLFVVCDVGGVMKKVRIYHLSLIERECVEDGGGGDPRKREIGKFGS